MKDEKTRKTLASVRSNIERGQKTKAINRLQGLINFNPEVVAYRELLGEVYYGVEWYEKAGEYWLLTDLRESRHEQCIEIFKESLSNSSLAILNKVKFRGEESSLPAVASQEYEALKTDCISRFGKAPHFKQQTQLRKKGDVQCHENEPAWSGTVVGSCLLLFFLLAILGLGVVFCWVFSLF